MSINKYGTTSLPPISTTPLRGDQQPIDVEDIEDDDEDYTMNHIVNEELPEFYPLGHYDYNRVPLVKYPMYRTDEHGGLFFFTFFFQFSSLREAFSTTPLVFVVPHIVPEQKYFSNFKIYTTSY